MANLLEWTFKLNDRVSGPAKSAASGLGDFIQTLHSGLAVMQYAAQGAEMLGRSLVSGIAPAVAKEKTLGSFETILHSAADATRLYAEAVQFANETPFETQDVVGAYKDLLAAQFKKEDLQTTVRIVGDASSMAQFPQQAMDSVNRALGQIKSKGKLSQEELNQVAEAVPLNQSMFLKNVATLFGMTEQQARKLKEAGGIDGDAGVFLLLQTLQQQFGGGMKKASVQVEGLWSTIKSMPVTYLERLYDTKGYEAIRTALVGVTQAFDPASERGQQFGLLVDKLGSGTLERVGVLLEYLTQGAAAFADGLMAGLGPLSTTFGPANQTNLEKFRTLMEGVGTGVASVAKGVGYLSDQLARAWNYFTKIGEWWAKNETLSGLLDEYVAPMFNAEQTGGKLRNTTPELLQARGGGGNNVEVSFDVPAFASGGVVDRPTLALIGEGGEREAVVPESRWPEVVGYGSPSSGPMIGHVSFAYHAASPGGDDSSSGKETQNIQRVVEAGILQALNRWQIQSGR